MYLYSDKEKDELITAYTQARTFVEKAKVIEEIAKKLNRSNKSIIAKLAYEKVYVKIPRRSKITGGRPKTKQKMIEEFEQEFGFESGSLDGFEIAPKLVIKRIYDKLNEFKNLNLK